MAADLYLFHQKSPNMPHSPSPLQLHAPVTGGVARRGMRWAIAIGVLIVGSLPSSLAPCRPSAPSRAATSSAAEEPITAILEAPAKDPLKVALGERLFEDPRLSHDNSRSCSSCHDLRTNGASKNGLDVGFNGASLPLNTLAVFNATTNFRYSWTGTFRTLESQAAASIEGYQTMGSSMAEVVDKLSADPDTKRRFVAAYGRNPDAENVLDAIASFERTLVTPGSRFDRWLMGDAAALSPDELNGYRVFKSLGCSSCHQGVNVGGNLFQRHGIFHPLASPKPEILRVPSLRNVATTPPYFHDGSAPTLEDAVRKMGYAQLNSTLTDQQISAIVAYLKTLTGNYRGVPVGATP
jgi:cytochrome c peroxidase